MTTGCLVTLGFRIYNSAKLPLHIIKVADLIDPVTRSCNKALLFAYFDPIDRDRIAQIPIPPTQVPDKLAWFPVVNGVFSTKNAYWFNFKACWLQKNNPPGSNNNSYQSRYWLQVWNPSVLPKLNILAWQASLNRLPLI